MSRRDPRLVRHPAGHATYPGDCSHMVGEAKGPTTFGTVLVASAATFYPGQDVTVVSFVTSRPDDKVTTDEHGTHRLFGPL